MRTARGQVRLLSVLNSLSPLSTAAANKPNPVSARKITSTAAPNAGLPLVSSSKLSTAATNASFPLHKLKSPSLPVPPAVLVANGSFSPITYFHLRLFEDARDTLSHSPQPKLDVLGGFISIVHDDYRRIKPSLTTSAAHRLNMCKAAVKDSDWIETSSFEIEQPSWLVQTHRCCEFLTPKTKSLINFCSQVGNSESARALQTRAG